MRFLANMCISPKTVEFLRSLGYEVDRASVLGLSRSKDREIIDYAAVNSMVLITMDLDVGRIIALLGRRKPSVILLRLRKPTVENINKKLSYTLHKTMDKLERGIIVVVEEQRIRVRELPLSEQ
jgi:predicted nuclease of predicted toxin-antitoxin system